MHVYLFATVLGLLGLILMGVLGMAHSAHHGHAAHAHGSGPLKILPANALHAGHGNVSHSAGSPPGTSPPGAPPSVHHASPGGMLLTLASPRVLLSLTLGFGLSGLALSHLLPALVVLPLAVLGAALFEGLLVRPYWNFLLKFESSPALTLASAAGSPAQAATDFDARGGGLVTFELNGETRQMLAHLGQSPGSASPAPVDSPSSGSAARVRRGDALTIESVDEAANACTVRRS